MTEFADVADADYVSRKFLLQLQASLIDVASTPVRSDGVDLLRRAICGSNSGSGAGRRDRRGSRKRCRECCGGRSRRVARNERRRQRRILQLEEGGIPCWEKRRAKSATKHHSVAQCGGESYARGEIMVEGLNQ